MLRLEESTCEGNARAPVVCFGPFRLLPDERRLERGGVEIRLGGRALDLLIVLVEFAGEVVSKKDLMARVWPDVVVDEGSLRFHMTALRKALGDDMSERYIATVSGKGYCFAASVSDHPDLPVTLPPSGLRNTYRALPPRPDGVLGRDQIIRTISERLIAKRFVTLVGPGGIGKTTVALCVGHALSADFREAVHFIDLAQISDPGQVAGEIASALGLLQYVSGMTKGLVTFLNDKRLLIILDNCEHVIGEAAAVAERIIRETPSVHILATSRETLQVEGERVHRLYPLDYPSDEAGLTATEARKYPAVQFFVERATANSESFSLDDENALIVADICRKLDGVALAIELAASGVDSYGLRGTAALLDGEFTLPFRGKRTANPRHQTLRATLDWSYTLLSDFERIVLRRLAIFVGPFSIADARSVVATNDVETGFIVDSIASLVSKSLVTTHQRDGILRYRLLYTTRTYGRERLREFGEADATSGRHALYFCDLLNTLDANDETLSKSEWMAQYDARIGDVRAALEWSFSPHGDFVVAVTLAAAAAPFLLEMSLFAECYQWTERAIAGIGDELRGTRIEMALQACFGQSMMLTKGIVKEAREAFQRGLDIATRLGDVDYAMRFLARLTEFHIRIGDFQGALALATQSEATARDQISPSTVAVASTLKGRALHLMGDQTGAIAGCRAAVSCWPVSSRINSVRYGIYDHGTALGLLARSLWLGGFPDQAAGAAQRCLQEAAESGHPIVICQSLVSTIAVFVWSGDFETAGRNMDKLVSHAAENSMGPYHVTGIGWKGVLEIKCGNLEAGAGLLRGAQNALSAGRSGFFGIAFGSFLAEALGMLGDFVAAGELIERALADAQLNGESYHGPESLRIKGELLASLPEPDWDQAEACFRRAIDVARQQTALSWELRAATSLARLCFERGRLSEAQDALAAPYARFTEGFGTSDLIAAKQWLHRLTSLAPDGADA